MKYLKNINLKNILCIILLGVFMQLFASMLLTEVISFFPKTEEAYAQTVTQLTKLTVRMIAYVCILAPVVEELVFRGVIMQLIKLKFPFFAANIVQALLFSFYHDDNVQKIYAFILGLFIGYLVHSLNNIVYGVVFHMSMNLSGVLEQNYISLTDNTVILIAVITASFVCIIVLMSIIYGRGFDTVRSLFKKDSFSGDEPDK